MNKRRVYIYFDGYLMGASLDLMDAVLRTQTWIGGLNNPQVFEPITFVIK